MRLGQPKQSKDGQCGGVVRRAGIGARKCEQAPKKSAQVIFWARVWKSEGGVALTLWLRSRTISRIRCR